MTPDEWYKSLTPVTKVYWSAAVITTILVTIGALNPQYLFLDWSLVFGKMHIWRIFTNFIFFGKFSMPFVFGVVLLVRYVGMCEGKFQNSATATADFLTMLLFGIISILLLDFFLIPSQYFYGSSLVFMCIYVWSRADPYAEMNFYGFAFKQWHTPFIFLIVGMLMGGGIISDCLGIGIGHLYYFLTELVPLNYGKTLIWTPDFMVQGVKMIHAKFAAAGAAPVADSSAPRPNWQAGQGHRLG